MRVPLEWLKQFVPVRLSPEELARRLTMAGSEVTRIERVDGKPVLDFEITPNRPDCLSIIGIAREVAAITGQKLKAPKFGFRSQIRNPQSAIRIQIEDRKGCRRYIGRLLEGVRLGPSPAWMQRRLAACGLRPINNIVDVTNYVLLERGQPLHAFDFEELGGGAVVVRRARAGEKLVAIDGTECVLTPEVLVIADAAQPVAVAGVMGGRDTQVNEHTTAVLLESAEFDPLVVRRTARRLGLASESSYRFERGVDPRGVEAASARAAHLIMELAGGREAAVLDVGERASKPVVIRLEPSRVQRWLGAPIPPSKAQQALQRLGLSVRKGAKHWRVSVPSFRRDLTQDVDLLEEIARLVGYERLPDTMPSAPLASARKSGPSSYEAAQRLRETCAGLGLSEIITWALVSEGELSKANQLPEHPLKLSNPLSADHAILRPTLLIGMLRTIANNYAQGTSGMQFFEIGHIFGPRFPGAERSSLGVAASGILERHWQSKREEDFFKVKGILEQLVTRWAGRVDTTGIAEDHIQIRWIERGTGVRFLTPDRQELGILGQVARRVTDAFDIGRPVWFGEVNVDALLPLKRKAVQAKPLDLFPPVKRDMSFLVDKNTSYQLLEDFIYKTGRLLAQHIEMRVELIDRYDGSQVPKDKHSLTVSIDYRDPSRTLTASEVDAVHRGIAEQLAEVFGAQLR